MNDIFTKEREKKDIKSGFENWQSNPTTKLAISMVPQTDPPEVLMTLLESCYEAGFRAGQGQVAIVMLETLVKDMTKKNSGGPPHA